jgi:hypothetical protein
MARSFREAEEASNAQGTVQASLDWALANAKKNPTPENIAIAKDTFAARQATLAAQPSPADIVKSVDTTVSQLPTDYKNINKTIGEIDTNIADVNAAGAELNAVAATTGSKIVYQPIGNVTTTEQKRTLALETFRNTLALFFGKDEVQMPWVSALFGVTSRYYNTGSTIDEAINLSVQDARNNPELKTFADRFKGIYSLQDRLAKGEAISVPTVAEYFKSESDMGDVLRQAGMGDLATQDFLGGVLGLGKSVLEVTNLINDTFDTIDNAPAALKADLQSFLQLGISRTDIAKALLTGAEGAKALNKKIEAISTLSAAKSQNVTIDMATAADIAARGYDYNKSLAGFADVKRLERGQMLGKMSGIDFTQKDAIAAQFESNYAAQDKIAKIGEEEVNRFSGRSGRLNSQNRAQGQI